MGIFPGVVTFLIIWWTVLFAVLPLGVRGQFEDDAVVPGSEPGAPQNAQLGRKLLITTGVTSVLWLIVFTVVSLNIIDLRTH